MKKIFDLLIAPVITGLPVLILYDILVAQPFVWEQKTVVQIICICMICFPLYFIVRGFRIHINKENQKHREGIDKAIEWTNEISQRGLKLEGKIEYLNCEINDPEGKIAGINDKISALSERISTLERENKELRDAVMQIGGAMGKNFLK